MVVTILIFLLVLGVLIFVHELGHFLAAKRAGLTVHEFGFGFPPRIFGVRRGGTIYSLNWIPMGGFVKIKGENGEDAAPDSFSSLSAGRRVVILLAGVTMNVLLAAVLLSFNFTFGIPTPLDETLPANAQVRDQRIQVISVVAETPAAELLRPGDAIVAIDNITVTTVTDIQEYNASHEGQEERVTVRRGEKEEIVFITPKKVQESDEHAVWGVNLVPVATVSYPWYSSLWYGARQAVILLWQILVAFFDLLKNLIVHQKLSADIAGPVGIAVLTGQIVDLGALYVLQFAALLSLNLAIINVLPFPALDGGRVLFVMIERIRGRKISPKVEAVIHNVGFALLLLLVFVITIRDVDRLSGGLLDALQRLIGRTGG